MRRMPSIVVVFVFALLLAAPGVARAEWFVEPYLGAAFTSDSNIDVDASAPGVVLKFSYSDVNFEDSLLLGIRGGYWFPSLPNLGVALDFFHFKPEVKSQTTTVTATAAVVVGNTLVVAAGTGPANTGNLDINVVVLSPNFMVRLKLMESADLPNGQFQPYAFAGPAIFFVEVENEDDVNVGLNAGVGIRWMFSKNFGLFAEYRFTRVNMEVEATEGAATVKLDTDLSTHSVLGGLSFLF